MLKNKVKQMPFKNFIIFVTSIVVLEARQPYTKQPSARPYCSYKTQVVPNTVIWDFGGVLLDFSHGQYINHIGKFNLVRFLILDWHNPLTIGDHIQDKMFDVLNQVPLPEPKNFKHAHTTAGVSLPYIVSAYQGGTITPECAVKMSLETLEKLDRDHNYFMNLREREIIAKSIEAIFTPKVHAAATYKLRCGMQVLRKINALTNEFGQKKYKQLVLSNWETRTFEQLRQPLLKNCLPFLKDVIISGDIGIVKPNAKPFDILVKRHNLIPAACIFIDDQEENIEAARHYGIGFPILFKNPQQLYYDLKCLGIL